MKTRRRNLGMVLTIAVLVLAAPLAADSPHAKCAAYGTIVVGYDSATATFTAETFGNSPYPAEAKTILVDLDGMEPGQSKICYDVLLLSSAKAQNIEIRVKFDNLVPANIFNGGGETDPKKVRKKEMTLDAAPTSWDDIEYPAGAGGFIQGKRVKFDVRIKAGNAGPWIKVDPDVIIQKPRG